MALSPLFPPHDSCLTAEPNKTYITSPITVSPSPGGRS